MQNNSGNPIRQINPPELGKPPGYSQVVDVRAGRIIFIAGQTAPLFCDDNATCGPCNNASRSIEVIRSRFSN